MQSKNCYSDHQIFMLIDRNCFFKSSWTLVSFVRTRTCPQILLKGEAPCLHRKCKDMLDNVGKTRRQILSSRPSLKHIPWTLEVFVYISWTFVDIWGNIWNLQHIWTNLLACPQGFLSFALSEDLADMSRTNETKSWTDILLCTTTHIKVQFSPIKMAFRIYFVFRQKDSQNQ
jgi:hypothetical protein